MPLKHTVEEIILENGVKGLLIDVPDATVVSYNINFRAGHDYAERSAEQTAHIMEHMVASGQNKHFPEASLFSREFKRNGAYVNASTYPINVNYIVESAVMEWDRILDLLKFQITEPIFKQEWLDSEKGNVREEMTSYLNNFDRVINQSVRKAMHITDLDLQGRIDTINNVQLTDIEDFYHKTHTLNNMRFTLVGDMSKHKSDIIEKFKSWDLPSGNRLPIASAHPQSAPAFSVYRDIPNLTYDFRIVVNRILSRYEAIAMRLLNHILAGTFHSRILGAARRDGISYHLWSNTFHYPTGQSEWRINGDVKPDNAMPLFELIINQLTKVIQHDLSNQELIEAKQYQSGKYQMRGQTATGLSDWYAMNYYDFERIDDMQSYLSEIDAVTIDDITKLAKEFISTNNIWTFGVVGNVSNQQLQQYSDIFSHLFNK